MARKGQKIKDLLAEVGAAAEDDEVPDQRPEHVQVSRPSLGRATRERWRDGVQVLGGRHGA